MDLLLNVLGIVKVYAEEPAVQEEVSGLATILTNAQSFATGTVAMFSTFTTWLIADAIGQVVLGAAVFGIAVVVYKRLVHTGL